MLTHSSLMAQENHTYTLTHINILSAELKLEGRRIALNRRATRNIYIIWAAEEYGMHVVDAKVVCAKACALARFI